MKTSTEIYKIVMQAAKILDSRHPLWYKAIDLSVFDMQDNCILFQMEKAGLRVIWNKREEEDRMIVEDACMVFSGYREIALAGEVQAYWTSQIRQRS